MESIGREYSLVEPIWSFASALGRLRGFVIRAGRPL
jgi:hypothetical protein